MLIYRCVSWSFICFVFWECHWTDNASVQPTAVSLTDSVSVWRPACFNLPVLWDTLVCHSNEKHIEGCMHRQKTLQLMQLMTQNIRHILSELSDRLRSSEPHLSLHEKAIAGLTGWFGKLAHRRPIYKTIRFSLMLWSHFSLFTQTCSLSKYLINFKQCSAMKFSVTSLRKANNKLYLFI